MAKKTIEVEEDLTTDDFGRPLFTAEGGNIMYMSEPAPAEAA